MIIEKYNENYEIIWDKFIDKDSLNGTFLQSRNFLKYHSKGKFIDHSLLIKKGNDLVAVIPACEINEECNKIFYSHKGSTFGGIVISKKYNNVETINEVVSLIDTYLELNNFYKAYLKLSSNIFNKKNCSLIDYFLFKYDYKNFDELSLVIDNTTYNKKIELNFTASKRRDYKYSLNNNLQMKKLEEANEIIDFYKLLELSLKKYNIKPIHSIEELMDFKDYRLKGVVDFYGVYYNDNLIAGTMVFKFEKNVYHTQYLAAHPDYLKLFPMNFLNYNLIKEAYDGGFKYFSFGINTEEKGLILNNSLAIFKEGFGAEASINKTYYKVFDKNKV